MTNRDKRKNTLGVGIVGCGYFGKKRIQTCLGLKNKISLLGITDVDIKTAKQTGKQYGIRCALSLNELLENSAIDAVIVAVPNLYHADVSIASLSKGKHVLCEKPLAISSKEAKKIVQASKKYKRHVKTGSNHRFFPTVKHAHKLIKDGKVGNILAFLGTIGTNGKRTQNTWFWNKQMSGGGTVIDNGCHLIDIARMFMGDFISCTGSTSNLYWKKSEVEDFGTGLLTTKSGSTAIITSSWIQWAGYLYFEIWGDKGYIVVDNRKEERVILGKKNTTKSRTYDFSQLPITSYSDELSYFADCILKNRKPTPSAEDGMMVIKTIEAIHAAGVSGRRQKI